MGLEEKRGAIAVDHMAFNNPLRALSSSLLSFAGGEGSVMVFEAVVAVEMKCKVCCVLRPSLLEALNVEMSRLF